MAYRESADLLAAPPGWGVYRQGRAGQVNYQLLKRNAHDDQGGLSRNV
jgi:hypothetical protein